jgi:hypothetical protein
MLSGSLVRIAALWRRAVVTTTASTTSTVLAAPSNRPASCASLSPRETTTQPVKKRRSWACCGDRLTCATCVQPTPAARFYRRPRERRRRRPRRSCWTPGRSRCSELRPHAAASVIHLFRGEGSVLLFPQSNRCQTSPPTQCFARRSGHPRRDAHPVAGGRRKDVFVNVRVYGDSKLR